MANRWTLTDLAALAARALADTDVRVVNGRATGVPDGRLIRWYTTIGLLDRPAIGPDRYARYGMRHLLQLVAVKRLQARGLAIAEIQARLAGATEAQLHGVAALPPGLVGVDVTAVGVSGDDRTDAPAPRPTADRFWARHPEVSVRSRPGRPSPEAPPIVDRTGDTVTRVHGLRLHGLTLLLAAEPAPHDLDAIAVAARPLLDLLAARGLLHPTEGA